MSKTWYVDRPDRKEVKPLVPWDDRRMTGYFLGMFPAVDDLITVWILHGVFYRRIVHY